MRRLQAAGLSGWLSRVSEYLDSIYKKLSGFLLTIIKPMVEIIRRTVDTHSPGLHPGMGAKFPRVHADAIHQSGRNAP